MDELMNYVSRSRKSGLGAQLYNSSFFVGFREQRQPDISVTRLGVRRGRGYRHSTVGDHESGLRLRRFRQPELKSNRAGFDITARKATPGPQGVLVASFALPVDDPQTSACCNKGIATQVKGISRGTDPHSRLQNTRAAGRGSLPE